MGALWTAIGLAVFVVIILALLGIAMEPGTSSYEGRSQPLFAPAPLPEPASPPTWIVVIAAIVVATIIGSMLLDSVLSHL
jgi:tryptophan-rich sensory protein